MLQADRKKRRGDLGKLARKEGLRKKERRQMTPSSKPIALLKEGGEDVTDKESKRGRGSITKK